MTDTAVRHDPRPRPGDPARLAYLAPAGAGTGERAGARP